MFLKFIFKSRDRNCRIKFLNSLPIIIQKTPNCLGSQRKRTQRNALNEAIQRDQTEVSGCLFTVSRGRFLRNLWRRCRASLQNFRHCTHQTWRGLWDRNGAGWISASLLKHLFAQARKSRIARGHLRSIGRPKNHQNDCETWRNRTRNARGFAQRRGVAI